jgi:hypothetical protein
MQHTARWLCCPHLPEAMRAAWGGACCWVALSSRWVGANILLGDDAKGSLNEHKLFSTANVPRKRTI